MSNLNPLKKKSPFDALGNTPYNLLKKYIIAQSKLETGNFTSRLYNDFNNGFGMKNARTRAQLGEPVATSAFRKYSSLDESIQDFILYLNFVNFPTVFTSEDYVRELKKRQYFEENESDYLMGLQSWL